MSMYRKICVTNRHLAERPFLEQLERVLATKPYAMILREKDLTEEAYEELAGKVKKLCENTDTRLILHSFPDAAMHLGGTAIHMPLHRFMEMPEEQKQKFLVRGVSVHSVEDAHRAEQCGATYLTAGHVFVTDCKKGINPGELIDLAETMPFFADRRLIVIENSGFFKNASPELADYIKTMPDTACLLFVENEADKRGKMYKAVKSKGRVVEMARQDEKTLLYWVAGNVKKEGYKIKEQTARYLLSTTGTDMENLEKELEKLFCYCMGKEEIEVRDIEAICTTQITNKIFEMVEAVAVRNQKKALDYYYDLLALKEPPMRILYLLTRQFKLLLEVKDLAGKRYDKAAIAKTVGLHPFVAGKYMQQCRTFEKKELRSILEDAVDTEELVKTGRLNDVMSVELFIVKYSAA